MAKSSKKKQTKKEQKKTAKKDAKKVSKKAVKKTGKKSDKKSDKKSVKKSPGKKRLPARKFLILYHAPAEAMAQTVSATPEEMAAGMEMWKSWAKKVGERMEDLGAPLANGTRLDSSGAKNPSSKNVSGYSLINADTWEELLELLEGHPHLSGWHPEASIEIHETMFIPGM